MLDMVAKEDERLSNCLRLQVTNVYAVLGSVHESAAMEVVRRLAESTWIS